MPTHNEIVAAAQRELLARAANQKHQLTTQREVGRRAQTVVEHPGYQVLLDHVEGLMAAAKKQLDAKAGEMVVGDKLGDELNALKLSVVRLDAEIKSLQQVVDLIPTLIERGHQAAEILERA